MGGNKNWGEKRGVALEPRTSQERPLLRRKACPWVYQVQGCVSWKDGRHPMWKMRSGSTFLPPLFDTVTHEGKNRWAHEIQRAFLFFLNFHSRCIECELYCRSGGRVIVYLHNIVHCPTRTFEVCLLSLAWIGTPRYLFFCQIRQFIQLRVSWRGLIQRIWTSSWAKIIHRDAWIMFPRLLTTECGHLHQQYFLKGCQTETTSATRAATILHSSAKPLPAQKNSALLPLHDDWTQRQQSFFVNCTHPFFELTLWNISLLAEERGDIFPIWGRLGNHLSCTDLFSGRTWDLFTPRRRKSWNYEKERVKDY